MDNEEIPWRIQIRATWLAKGDNNGKKIHNHANYRKSVNTIKEVGLIDGSRENSFRDIARVGNDHFQNLFKYPNIANIRDFMIFLGIFPKCFDHRM